MVLDKLISREKKLTIKKRDAEILAELRKPQEDSELANQKDLPELQRLPGLKLTGQALSDLLMVFEFLHNFGETLGFGKSENQTFIFILKKKTKLTLSLFCRHGFTSNTPKSSSSTLL